MTIACCTGPSAGQEGTLDLSFNVGTGLNNQIWAMALQPDGKILIGGMFTSYNGTPCNHLARLNSDGSFDNTFSIGTGPNDKVSAIAVQPDGKILVGGHFGLFNGVLQNHLARLDPNGSLDPTFVPDLIGISPSLKIQVQADGKILVLEDPAPTILRLNANGTSDGGIPSGTFAVNNTITDFDLQPDGKILVGGGFTMHNGTPRMGITRINTDFTLDPTFTPVTGADWVHTIAHQQDGKILIGGDFTNIGGAPRPGVARLNTSGSLDNGFDTDTVGGDIVTKIMVQPDGKILMGVQFPFPPVPPFFTLNPFFYRLNANGSVDNGFQFGTGPNGYPQALAIQPDGRILIGGSFTTYNGTNRLRIARINGTSRVGIKIMLEGPYSGGQMTDALRTLLSFPHTAPFTAMGYSEPGYVSGATINASTLSVTGNNAIVDWVLVEMRPVGTPGVVAATRAVLLQRDGDVVDLDGTSTVGFAGLASGSYCVAVKPRTHLPVMLSTSTPVIYGDAIATVDFTLPTTQVHDNDARKNVGGVMVLTTGDAVFNENIQYTGTNNDRDPILVRVGGTTPTATVNGYWPEDVNMDGVVKYVGTNNDRDPILVNVGGTTPAAVRHAELP